MIGNYTGALFPYRWICKAWMVVSASYLQNTWIFLQIFIVIKVFRLFTERRHLKNW